MLTDLDHKLWLPEAPSAAAAFSDARICGPEAVQQGWLACRGSLPDARGFPCGLWMMLHTSAARVPAVGGGETFMRGVRAFGHHFFQCHDCQQHLLHMLNTSEALQVGIHRCMRTGQADMGKVISPA